MVRRPKGGEAAFLPMNRRACLKLQNVSGIWDFGIDQKNVHDTLRLPARLVSGPGKRPGLEIIIGIRFSGLSRLDDIKIPLLGWPRIILCESWGGLADRALIIMLPRLMKPGRISLLAAARLSQMPIKTPSQAGAFAETCCPRPVAVRLELYRNKILNSPTRERGRSTCAFDFVNQGCDRPGLRPGKAKASPVPPWDQLGSAGDRNQSWRGSSPALERTKRAARSMLVSSRIRLEEGRYRSGGAAASGSAPFPGTPVRRVSLNLSRSGGAQIAHRIAGRPSRRPREAVRLRGPPGGRILGILKAYGPRAQHGRCPGCSPHANAHGDRAKRRHRAGISPEGPKGVSKILRCPAKDPDDLFDSPPGVLDRDGRHLPPLPWMMDHPKTDILSPPSSAGGSMSGPSGLRTSSRIRL